MQDLLVRQHLHAFCKLFEDWGSAHRSCAAVLQGLAQVQAELRPTQATAATPEPVKAIAAQAPCPRLGHYLAGSLVPSTPPYPTAAERASDCLSGLGAAAKRFRALAAALGREEEAARKAFVSALGNQLNQLDAPGPISIEDSSNMGASNSGDDASTVREDSWTNPDPVNPAAAPARAAGAPNHMGGAEASADIARQPSEGMGGSGGAATPMARQGDGIRDGVPGAMEDGLDDVIGAREDDALRDAVLIAGVLMAAVGRELDLKERVLGDASLSTPGEQLASYMRLWDLQPFMPVDSVRQQLHLALQELESQPAAALGTEASPQPLCNISRQSPLQVPF